MPPRSLPSGLLVGLLAGVLMLSAPAVYAQATPDSTYTVQDGDTLYRIAQRAGVSVETLMRWNDLDTAALQVGQTLRIQPPAPSPTPTAPPPADTVAPDTTPDAPAPRDTTAAAPYGTHTVEPSDTFVGLALRLGTTADTLFALNDRTTDTLAVGRTLRLPRRFGPPTHVVDSSETLYSIAGAYGVSVRALRSLNDLDTTALEPGRRLRLPERPNPYPPGTRAAPDTSGAATIYPPAFAGRLMASGRAYNPDDYVVSHPSLPFGSIVLLSRPDGSAHTFARVQDRGSVTDDLLLDLSATVAERLGIASNTTPTVALRVVWRAAP